MPASGSCFIIMLSMDLYLKLKVAKSIKRARHFGILPHIGDYEVQEVRPYIKRDNFHDIVETERIINSKTVL